MSISLPELTSKAFEETAKNVGESCKLKNNDKCFFTNETNFNSTCCSDEEPCGILQGGCDSDEHCFDNLECVADTCGLSINGTKCCQAPGRKPG